MAPPQTFHDHISELRRRLAWVVVVIGGSTAVGYAFRMPIITFLQHPLGAPLFYTSPAGSFNFILKTSTMLGIIIALPLIVYHSIRFVEPALSAPIRRSVIARVIFFATVLAVMGAAFGFFIIVPTSLHFFSGYSSATIKPLISADEYLSFVLGVLVTFGLLFQIPLVVLFINSVKRIRPGKLLKYQRHVVVGAFVLAVILPFTYDPVTQLVMAIPIVFLYYLSVILVWSTNRRAVYEGDVIAEAEMQVMPQVQEPTIAVLSAPKSRAIAAWTTLELEPVLQFTSIELTPQKPVAAENIIALPRDPEPKPVTVANIIEIPREPVPEPASVVAAFAAQSPAVHAIWQTKKGGLKSSHVLRTAVDILKPGTISGQPLALDHHDLMKVSRFNTLDLSSQA